MSMQIFWYRGGSAQNFFAFERRKGYVNAAASICNIVFKVQLFVYPSHQVHLFNRKKHVLPPANPKETWLTIHSVFKETILNLEFQLEFSEKQNNRLKDGKLQELCTA